MDDHTVVRSLSLEQQVGKIMQTASHAYVIDEFEAVRPAVAPPPEAGLVGTVGDRRFPPSQLATLLGVLIDAGVDGPALLEGTSLFRQDLEEPVYAAPRAGTAEANA